MNIPGIVFLLTMLTLMTGCAPTFSPETVDHVDRNVTFSRLQTEPDRYKGKWVMLSGVIISTRNTKEGTFIEVLQRPMDRRGRPLETDATEGRFLISSSEFLDSAVYHPGKRISVIAEVKGQITQPLGEILYRYPLLSAKELRLWEPRTSPRFSFGFGLGIYHRF